MFETVIEAASRTPNHSLASVPQELTEHILKFCHPHDIASVSETCKTLRDIIYNEDEYLWRTVFLMYPFDDIRLAIDPKAAGRAERSIPTTPDTKDKAKSTWSWRSELQRRVFAEGVLRRSGSDGLDGRKLLEAIEILNDTLSSSAPATSSFIAAGSRTADTDISFNLAWVEDILLHSKVFRGATTSMTEMIVSDPSIVGEIECLSARLRCYLSLVYEKGTTGETENRLQLLRSDARCFVYNLANYRNETRWGPYKLSRPSDQMSSSANGNDWRQEECTPELIVNWEHVEHVRNVMFMNLRELPSHWRGSVIPNFDIQATRPWSAPGYLSGTRNSRDWAGIEGVWRRVVCFMDYRCVCGLTAYNYNKSGKILTSHSHRDLFCKVLHSFSR